MPSTTTGSKEALRNDTVLLKAKRLSAGPKVGWKTRPNLVDRFTDRLDVKVRAKPRPRHKQLGVVRQSRHIKSLTRGGIRAALCKGDVGYSVPSEASNQANGWRDEASRYRATERTAHAIVARPQIHQPRPGEQLAMPPQRAQAIRYLNQSRQRSAVAAAPQGMSSPR